MKQIQKSQARAIVGGGFFKSLFKVATFGLTGAVDPVTAAGVGGAVDGARRTLNAM
jgi:hypothetical protein